MIERDIAPCLVELFGQYPFVTVTGPRQSGKTTLCRAAFPHLKYVNLEARDQREFARSDPRGFLAQVGHGTILDEIQRVPDLLSYLQVVAGEKRRNSLFVLTGSQHFKLSGAINQSLAGRTGLLRLLRVSLPQRERTGAGNTVEEILYSGFYLTGTWASAPYSLPGTGQAKRTGRPDMCGHPEGYRAQAEGLVPLPVGPAVGAWVHRMPSGLRTNRESFPAGRQA